MNCNRRALCGLSLVMAACATSHPLSDERDTGPAEHADAGTVDLDGGPSLHASGTYVVSTIDTDADDPTRAYGFDIDHSIGGIPSLPCTGIATDFVSPITGASGVDNQWINLLPVVGMMVGADGANGGLRDQIQTGALLIVFQVGDVDSYANDASVSLRTVLARVPMGSTLRLDGAGLAPDQALETLVDLGSASGAITDGRLEADIASALPMFGFGLPGAPVSLRDGHLGGRISPSALSQVELGGYVSVDEVATWMSGFIGGVDVATVQALTNADAQPDPADAGGHCMGISAGVELEAVGAFLADAP
jgi:hypothetical protein